MGLANDVGETPDEVLAKGYGARSASRSECTDRCALDEISLQAHGNAPPRGAAWGEASLQSRTSQTEDFREGTRVLEVTAAWALEVHYAGVALDPNTQAAARRRLHVLVKQHNPR